MDIFIKVWTMNVLSQIKLSNNQNEYLILAQYWFNSGTSARAYVGAKKQSDSNVFGVMMIEVQERSGTA